MKLESTEKQHYKKPALKTYGSVESLTQGSSHPTVGSGRERSRRQERRQQRRERRQRRRWRQGRGYDD